eukprot:EG_transcript_29964
MHTQGRVAWTPWLPPTEAVWRSSATQGTARAGSCSDVHTKGRGAARAFMERDGGRRVIVAGGVGGVGVCQGRSISARMGRGCSADCSGLTPTRRRWRLEAKGASAWDRVWVVAAGEAVVSA